MAQEMIMQYYIAEKNFDERNGSDEKSRYCWFWILKRMLDYLRKYSRKPCDKYKYKVELVYPDQLEIGWDILNFQHNYFTDKENNWIRLEIREAVENLEEPYKTVIKGKYFEDRTFRTIAKELNLCTTRATQLHQKALGLLKISLQNT